MLYRARPVTVNLTRIYTRLGDGGETHLGDMSRVPKTHGRIEAYGTVDELNAQLGVALAMPNVPERIGGWLEGACDEVNAELPNLKSFVLPGGTPLAAQLHVCRTVCRRAERRTIACGDEVSAECVRYLNRLSDLLFILSRAANVGAGESEPLWEPGRFQQ
jgi:cob(I)alamin adenosyltransferase